ncbi:cytochrome c oxidase subunit 3 [Pseudoxanthobacter soli DSM 19599]|uniref:Cytochrome c oxidase subunit 3 n=1 Tax=Pseudoxanthobacter soli DSM 19599 TaxID=1123029 RepID=A0A1M7Z556_9HYPH|nr:cytochrome c oxidase subunit 3 [Pseudoxanthobacter soli]SHO60011.1 cytochrome c oxidase subunit 3 [Pseudoxanthobacter soli DSM 19599]
MAEAHTKNHDYHLVDPSPWPIVASVGAFVMAFGGIAMMRWLKGEDLVIFGVDTGGWGIFAIGTLIVLYAMYGWWGDTITEGMKGFHTRVVDLHLRYGMILFIASEVMFFVAWFWAYFNVALFPASEKEVVRDAFTGGVWPPKGIETFDPWHLPLLNTLILLTSGTTVTWAHHAVLNDDREGLKWGLALTVMLGLMFSMVQGLEYSEATFAYSGNIYGATFFMATGFHGFHVIVGTIFLAICLIRALKGQFSSKAHFGLEAAAWYWHFVDVVWLFLFACIYVWGASPAFE